MVLKEKETYQPGKAMWVNGITHFTWCQYVVVQQYVGVVSTLWPCWHQRSHCGLSHWPHIGDDPLFLLQTKGPFWYDGSVARTDPKPIEAC